MENTNVGKMKGSTLGPNWPTNWPTLPELHIVHSMKLARSIATPPGWDASPSQVIPKHGRYPLILLGVLEPRLLDPESNMLTIKCILPHLFSKSKFE